MSPSRGARSWIGTVLGIVFLAIPGVAELRDPDPAFVPRDCPRRVDYAKHARLGASGPTLRVRGIRAPESGADAGGADAETNEDYAEVGLFYATNRGRSDSCKPAKIYGKQLGRLEVGRVLVTVPRDHRMGELEGPSIWKFQFREDPAKHVTVVSVDPTDAKEFYRELRESVQRAPRRQAFVFIHGYNSSFEDAARRTAQIAYDLKFPGAPILYSWPSAGSVSAYHRDREAGARSAEPLAAFLDELRRESGADTIHLIAHSMGNHPLSLALRELVPTKPGRDLPLFEEIVLAAPDIDAEVFEKEIAPVVTAAASRVTLYASSRDRALQMARDFLDFRRLGDSSDEIPILGSIETIDASFIDTSFTGHSYFGENRSVISDLYNLLRNRQPAGDRFGLVPVDTGRGTYWRFQR